MAFLGQTFSTETLPQSENNYDLLPAGWYNVKITKAELKDTKSGTGSYINVRYDITGPTHQGRVVFGMINITNQNPKAEEIGRQQLGELMRAIGLARVEDTDQLIGGELQIKVGVKEAKDGYDASNDVKGFKAIGGGIPVANKPAASAQAAAPAASKAPWATK